MFGGQDGHSALEHSLLGRGQRSSSEQLNPVRSSNPLTAELGPGKRAPYLREAWVSAPAVDAETEAARCLGASETPFGLHLCGEALPRASVIMSVLDALWEDRDIRFDVSSQ